MRKNIILGVCMLALTAVISGCGQEKDNASENTTQLTKTEEAGTADADSGETKDMEAQLIEVTDYMAEQAVIDEQLMAEVKKGYTVEEPLIVVNPYGNSPLTAVMIFTTAEETGVSLQVKGDKDKDTITAEFTAAKEHILPVYGLYAGRGTEVVLKLDDGTENSFEITTDPVDAEKAEAAMLKEASYDYNKLTFASLSMQGAVAAYDSEGDVRWYFKSMGMPFKQLKNGRFISQTTTLMHTMYYMTGVVEFDLTGKAYNEYSFPGGSHHAIYEMENGNLLVAGCVPDFSTVEDHIVEIDRKTGEIVWELTMSDLLEPSDGGSINRTDEDWFHNNAIWYDEKTDQILLSARHVDAVVAVNKTDKSLQWILGDPDGWEKTDKKYFFTPVGEDFEWQYAQHNVSMLEDGSILLFDNGAGRTKATKEDQKVTGDDVYSRAVLYALDTENMTIEQKWQYGKERGPEWYSSFISGADSIGENMYWLTSGGILYDEQNNNYDLLPERQFDPSVKRRAVINQVEGNELVYELVIPNLVYRSIRASLYGETNGSLNLAEKGQWLGSLGKTPQADVTLEASKTEAAPDNWTYTKTPVCFEFKGDIKIESADKLTDGYLILKDKDETAVIYPLTQRTSDAEDGSCLVNISAFISGEGLEGKEYTISVFAGDVTYETGKAVGF